MNSDLSIVKEEVVLVKDFNKIEYIFINSSLPCSLLARVWKVIESCKPREVTMRLINQYSFILLAIIIFLVLLVYFLRNGLGQREIIALGALLLGFTAAMFLFNPGDSTLSEEETAVDFIGGGTPILLEFQSPY